MSDQSDEDNIARDLAVLREAWSQVLADLRGMRSPWHQFTEATSLEEETKKMTGDAAGRRAVAAARLKDAGVSLSELGEMLGMSKQRVSMLVKKGQQIITAVTEAQSVSEGEDMIESSANPEPVPVVAAIVTSPEGVLIARRNDGKPPWTFIAGEIEPGESPADAAVREVKEETGLRIRAGGVIGRRVHPKTGRTMVYMAAQVTHGTDAFVGDTEELAEVRWVSLEEADELTGGTIFEPVRQHLKRMLGNGSAATAGDLRD